MQETIAFIGGGNMATSLIGGLIADGHPAEQIIVVDPAAERRQTLQDEYAVRVLPTCSPEAVAADVWVLAIKPQVMRQVVMQLPATQALIVSVAAGISVDSLAAWMQGDSAIVRCMPNTPALVGAGAGRVDGEPERERRRGCRWLRARRRARERWTVRRGVRERRLP